MEKYKLTGAAISVNRFLIGKTFVAKDKLTDKEGEILFKEKSPYIELVQVPPKQLDKV